MAVFRRSTVPPSMSTQRNMGVSTLSRLARSSSAGLACVGDVAREQDDAPGRSMTSIWRRPGVGSAPSKPMMRSWPTCWCRDFTGVRHSSSAHCHAELATASVLFGPFSGGAVASEGILTVPCEADERPLGSL